MAETSTAEDRQYLLACQALGINPRDPSGEKLSTNGNGSLVEAARNAAERRARLEEERERANLDAYQHRESARQRRVRQREENRRLWAAHYWRMAASHARICNEYLHKATALEEESVNGKA